MLIPFTFTIDLTMNLICGSHYECEMSEYHSLYFEDT